MCVFLLVHMSCTGVLACTLGGTGTGTGTGVVLVCVLVLAWYRMLPAACCLLPVMGD